MQCDQQTRTYYIIDSSAVDNFRDVNDLKRWFMKEHTVRIETEQQISRSMYAQQSESRQGRSQYGRE